MKQVVAIANGECQVVSVSSLIVMGGKSSSGVRLRSLKQSGDYVAISINPDGSLQLHKLLGANRRVERLEHQGMTCLLDLTLVSVDFSYLRKAAEPGDDGQLAQNLSELISAFANTDDLGESLRKTLDIFLKRYLFEKGIVAVAQPGGGYAPMSMVGLRATDPWLSETLIQDTLKSHQPIIIRNIMGSLYDNKKSLVGSGFVSVCSWPLFFRGEVIGVLMVGSSRPHDGIPGDEMSSAQSLVNTAAVLVKYHLRDLQSREEVLALRALSLNRDQPFLSRNQDMIKAARLAEQVANSNLSLLLQGETGTGKEVMARWIHQMSGRSAKPFIAVNCGAIPENLLESLLFGHRKGAFTGAVSDLIGKFQAANGGTIFLDEIGDLPANLQAKLLRVLQERVIEPLGSNRPVAVDIRVICATHKSLSEMVRLQKFRQDLFYRLAEVCIEIPPLRERPEDIPVLATQFLREFSADKCFSESAWNWLKMNSWRGNVRELKSAVQRAAILAQGREIGEAAFTIGEPKDIEARGGPLDGLNLEQAREEFTIAKVKQALILSKGKRLQAAEMLGVTQRTLFRYLEQYRSRLEGVGDEPEGRDDMTDMSQ